MGGTFDPIHLGHLVTAEQARVDCNLDEVIFVPAGQPWQKYNMATPAEQRYLMVVLATAGNPMFSVSRIEVDREGPTYTVDTLKYFKEVLEPDDEIVFTTGADAILNILTWKDAEQAMALATFVAATRPGYSLEALQEHNLTDQVTLLDVPALAISSTDIRQRFQSRRAVSYLIPNEVEQFARKHGLYGTAGTGLTDIPADRDGDLKPDAPAPIATRMCIDTPCPDTCGFGADPVMMKP